MKLSERQRFALVWLDRGTTPEMELQHDSRSGEGYAYELGSAMVRAKLIELPHGKRNLASQGAANTLVALKRRGLARNSTPGGEAFQSVRWGITEAGHAEAQKIKEER